MKKILIFLFFLILSNCTTFVFNEENVVCPKITSPKGAEQLIANLENDVKTYVGFRGIKSKCFSKGENIKMLLQVKIRAIRQNIKADEKIPLFITLVSIDKNKKEYDRDKLNYNLFLRENRKTIEFKTKMSVLVPSKGEVLIGMKMR
tara:strand:+ start:78 stop:518 length:441 start_codon:yes stop_codon:yes gene_type:complete